MSEASRKIESADANREGNRGKGTGKKKRRKGNRNSREIQYISVTSYQSSISQIATPKQHKNSQPKILSYRISLAPPLSLFPLEYKFPFPL